MRLRRCFVDASASVLRIGQTCLLVFLLASASSHCVLHRTFSIARHGVRGRVAAEWCCAEHSVAKLKLQLTYSQTPMCTHLVKASSITCRSDDRTMHRQDAHKCHVLLWEKVHVTLPMDP